MCGYIILSKYSFDLKQKGLTLNYCVYDFLLKYKAEIEKLNYSNFPHQKLLRNLEK